MTIEFQSIPSRTGRQSPEYLVPRCEASRAFFPDPQAAGSQVFTDLDCGVVRRETVHGPARANHTHSGMAVVAYVLTTAPGVLGIEVSPDGYRWTPGAEFAVHAHEELAVRFLPSVGFYRVSFRAVDSASRVFVTSQVRT